MNIPRVETDFYINYSDPKDGNVNSVRFRINTNYTEFDFITIYLISSSSLFQIYLSTFEDGLVSHYEFK
jgi:hypothetical protein